MRILLVIVGLFCSLQINAAPKADLWPFWQQADNSNQQQLDHGPWQQTLDQYLDANHSSGIHRFDYAAVSDQGRARLDGYISQLVAQDPRLLNQAEQKAYWINLYNAHTVQLVLAAYPVNSILKVQGGIFGRGPWHKKTLTIAGQKLSLNDVEHRILRPIWNDPRIHFAVNCASLGCPNLMPQAFTAMNAEAQLDDTATAFLQHPRGLRFEGDRLHLSKIFDWYQTDFASREADLPAALSAYLPPSVGQQLQTFSGDIKYHYDWALNKPD